MPGYNFKNFVERGEMKNWTSYDKFKKSFQILLPKKTITSPKKSDIFPSSTKKTQKMFRSAQTFSTSKGKKMFVFF